MDLREMVATKDAKKKPAQHRAWHSLQWLWQFLHTQFDPNTNPPPRAKGDFLRGACGRWEMPSQVVPKLQVVQTAGRGACTCGRALMEVMPQPRAPLEPPCSPLRQLSSTGAHRGPLALTGAAASTSPRGQSCTAAPTGHAVSREQGALAKAAPGDGNSSPSPSSSSAAASAAFTCKTHRTSVSSSVPDTAQDCKTESKKRDLEGQHSLISMQVRNGFFLQDEAEAEYSLIPVSYNCWIRFGK